MSEFDFNVNKFGPIDKNRLKGAAQLLNRTYELD